MGGEPNWREWALWLAVQLGVVLRIGANSEDRKAAQRALDEFDAEVRAHELPPWRDDPRDEPS